MILLYRNRALQKKSTDLDTELHMIDDGDGDSEIRERHTGAEIR